jgi:hypothetical protein
VASPFQNEYSHHDTKEYSHRDTRSTIRLTRRHHPLEGQVFDVVMSGRTQIVVRVPDGSVMRLPRAWTDADGAPLVRAAERVFTFEALRALLARVALLRPEA